MPDGASQPLTDGLGTPLFVDNGDPTWESSVSLLLHQGDCMFHTAELKDREPPSTCTEEQLHGHDPEEVNLQM